MEATGRSSVSIPIFATRTTFSGPTSSVRRAKTVLSELSVAVAIGTAPM